MAITSSNESPAEDSGKKNNSTRSGTSNKVGCGDALSNHLRRAASTASASGVAAGIGSGASTPMEHIFEADPEYVSALGGRGTAANIPLIDQPVSSTSVDSPTAPGPTFQTSSFVAGGCGDEGGGPSLLNHRCQHHTQGQQQRLLHRHHFQRPQHQHHEDEHQVLLPPLSHIRKTSSNGVASEEEDVGGSGGHNSGGGVAVMNPFQMSTGGIGNNHDSSWNKLDLGDGDLQRQQQQHPQHNGNSKQSKQQEQQQQGGAGGPGMRIVSPRGFDSDKYDRIDRIAMWLFPIIFFLFNLCYWSYYLLLNELLPELW